MAGTEQVPIPETPRRRRTWFFLLRLVVYTAVLIFMGRILLGLDWSALRSTPLSPMWLLAMLATGLMHRLLLASTWAALVRAVGGQIPNLPHFNLYSAKSWFGRYIPGKVGMVLGRMHLAPELGVTRPVLGVTALAEVILHLAVAMFIGIAILGASERLEGLLPFWRWMTLGTSVVILALLSPPVMTRTVAFAHRLRSHGDDPVPAFRTTGMLTALTLAVCASLVAGLHCGSAFAAVSGEFPTQTWAFLWGSLSLAGGLGIIAFVTPSGLGVREAVLISLLSHVGSVEVAVFVAVMLRAGEVIVDVVYLGLSWFAASDVAKNVGSTDT